MTSLIPVNPLLGGIKDVTIDECSSLIFRSARMACNWTVSEVAAWLSREVFTALSAGFVAQGINGHVLLSLHMEELKSELGVHQLQHTIYT